VLGGYVLVLCYFGIRTPSTFLTTDSLRNVLDQSAVPLILAVGLTLVLAVGVAGRAGPRPGHRGRPGLGGLRRPEDRCPQGRGRAE
jgi:hypothetical protein